MPLYVVRQRVDAHARDRGRVGAAWRGRMTTSLMRRVTATRRIGGGDVLDGEAEVLEQHAAPAPTRRSVSMPTTAPRGIVDGADVLAPAVGDAGFDRDARDAARQHRRAVRGVLAVEHAGAGHRHDAHRDAFLGERVARADAPARLPSRWR